MTILQKIADGKPRAEWNADGSHEIESLIGLVEKIKQNEINRRQEEQVEREQKLRVLLEESLQQTQVNERTFRAIVDNSPIGIIQLGTDLKYRSANAAYLQFLGYTWEELKDKTIMDVTHPEDLEATQCAARQFVKDTKTLSRFAKRYVTKAGKVVWALVTSRALRFEGEEGEHLLSVIEDVTELKEREEELKKAQAQLADSEALLRLVLKNVPSQIYVKDVKRDFEYKLVNSACAKFHGVLESDIVGKSDDQLFPPEQAKAIREVDEKLIATGLPVRLEKYQLHSSLGLRWVTTYKVPTFDEDGQPRLVIGITRDVTEEMTAKEELERARLGSIQNAKLASLGEMSAGIAHEINNPLAIIAGTLYQLPKVAGDQDRMAQKIETINRAVDRIAKIVLGLRKFSRSGDGFRRQRKQLREVVDESMILIAARLKQNFVRLKVDCRTDGWILCDSVEIEQVLVNLINNSIDAVKNLGEKWVSVSVFEQGEQVVLQVCDSGTGIAPEVEQKLFQPFFTTKVVGEGTGLGLSISKGILDKHDAKISLLKASPNTCFEIRFARAASTIKVA